MCPCFGYAYYIRVFLNCSSSNLFIMLLAFTDTTLSLCTVMCPVLIFSSFLSPSPILCKFLVSVGAYFLAGFVDWLPLLVVVILGWLFLRRGGVLRAADVDLLLLGGLPPWCFLLCDPSSFSMFCSI